MSPKIIYFTFVQMAWLSEQERADHKSITGTSGAAKPPLTLTANKL